MAFKAVSLREPRPSGRKSTIGQTVTNRPDLLIKCQLYHDDYGSGHKATYSERYLQVRRNPTTKTRKAYDRADWEKIRKEVQELFEQPGELNSAEALDTAVESLKSRTANAKDVNCLRHKWQESNAKVGRADYRTMAMFEDMRQSRRAWTRTIEKAKESH
ncbi:hypothetical protein N7447_007639 [Penicillium robsamsonii]|uniref:uncharacterized protein n=1 Tax=Penicillium robsamsonii TaxID=1792511 RepID=UPI0025474BF4|nr:uncharacterized protein N7447_007639 [Penicillium robsamsonii]KAJ5817631.1 hypothetical protein N7447_007639 [Penicillium robsamsonii]